jgi:tetratricopeptide (TPR) repeat protein
MVSHKEKRAWRKGSRVGDYYDEQINYTEAELAFRQSAQQREKVIGAEEADTFRSKYALAWTLCIQKKYSQAELAFRQLAQQQEKVLGAEDAVTLYSKYTLASTLYEQQKYSEAEHLLQELVRKFENALDQVNTLASKELLRKITLAKAPHTVTNTLADTVFTRLSDFFTDGAQKQTAYTDSEIQHISLLLSQVDLQWSKVPRTYIILRIIDCLDLLGTFIDVGFSDYWFPITERSLPLCVQPKKRSQFVAAQNLVITKSMDLEKGEKGQHCYFRLNEPPPLQMKGILGSGGFGQVDRVVSTISYREYALKRVSRNTVFNGRVSNGRQRKEWVTQFIAEIGILKRLRHHHVVEFIGSYTDPKYIGLIMSPVADMDLSTYLARADTARHGELRTFYGFLARALEFLHKQSIRHKDIKPSNILVHSGNVLFTDFGLAFDFTDEEGSTTVSMVNGLSPRYCAPEVAEHEPRNRASDIWSLGVVFLEMTAVLKGQTNEYVYSFLKDHGSGQAFVRTNPIGTAALIAELKTKSGSTDNVALKWVQDMTMLQQQLRPTAESLMTWIIDAGQSGDGKGAFCGICCASPDDITSDSDESV